MAPPKGAATRWRETAAPRDGRRAKRDSVRRELALAERLQLRQQVVRRQVAADLAAIGREDRRRAGNTDLHAERELLGNGGLALLRRQVTADAAAIEREPRRHAGTTDLYAERDRLGNGVLAPLRRRVLARPRRRERFLAVVAAPRRHRQVERRRADTAAGEKQVIDF